MTATFSVRLRWACSAEYVDRVSRLRSVALGHKTFQSTDRNRQVELSAAAGGLAWMTTDAAADRGKGIGRPGITVGFFILPFGDQRDISSSLRVHGTRLHAGKVRFQPFQIDELRSRRQPVRSGPWLCCLLLYGEVGGRARWRSTSTACVVTFPSSLQVFSVYLPGGTFLIS